MLKWIKSKYAKNDPVASHPELCLRVVCDEVKELKEKVEILENVVAVLKAKANGMPVESKIEIKPAPKKVGRPKKK